jgi:signal peptidase II
MQAARRTSIDEPRQQQPSRRQYRLLFALVALLGLLADFTTKVLVVHYLTPLRGYRLLGGLLTFRMTRNPGAAFSLGESYTFVFATLSLVVLVFVVWKLMPRIGHPAWAVALGLLCAGVSGNLTDRIFRQPGFLHGYVIDFMQLPYWPIFNVADTCICAAAVMIALLSAVKGITIDGLHYRRPPDVGRLEKSRE